LVFQLIYVKMKFLIYICSLALLFAIGCEKNEASKILQTYIPPNINLAELEANYLSKKTSAADLTKNINGNTFSDRVSSYLRRSPDVAALQSVIRKAQAQIKVTEDQKNAQISGGLTAGFDNQIQDYLGAGLTVSGEKIIFDAQKTDLSISEVSTQVALSEFQLAAFLESETLSIASSYLDFLEAEIGIELVQIRMKLLNDNLEKIDKLVDAAILNVADKVSGEIAASRLESLKENQNAQKKQAWSSLSRKLGSNLTFHNKEDVWKIFAKTSDFEFELANIPAVQIATLNLHTSKLKLLKAERGIAPIVKVTGAISQPLNELSDNETIRIGINVQTPLFKEKYLSSLIETEQLAVSYSESQLEKTLQDIMVQGEVLKSALSSAETNRKLIEESVELAERELQFLERQVKVGQANLSQLISSHSQLLDYELRLNSARFEYFQTKIRTLELNGRLREFLEIQL